MFRVLNVLRLRSGPTAVSMRVVVASGAKSILRTGVFRVIPSRARWESGPRETAICSLEPLATGAPPFGRLLSFGPS